MNTKKPLQVLLAVDNLILRKILTAVLELEGHTVTARDCALRTLRTLHERPFGLILVDLSLTGGDVHDLITAASQLQPDARVALLCEEDMPGWAGSYPCISKAFDKSQLMDLLAGVGDYESAACEEEDVA
jgi:DNA-binding NtrC family response regulator